MDRRAFLKNFTLAPMSVKEICKEDSIQKNILEFCNIKISFPFAKDHDVYSLKIYQHTLNLLKTCENKEILIHHYNEQSTMYAIDTDDLLVFLHNNDDYNYLEYATIELFYNNKPIKLLDDMSLLFTIKYPRIDFLSSKINVRPTLDNIFSTYYQNPCAPLNTLTISISGDLHYRAFECLDKKFDILKLRL